MNKRRRYKAKRRRATRKFWERAVIPSTYSFWRRQQQTFDAYSPKMDAALRDLFNRCE